MTSSPPVEVGDGRSDALLNSHCTCLSATTHLMTSHSQPWRDTCPTLLSPRSPTAPSTARPHHSTKSVGRQPSHPTSPLSPLEAWAQVVQPAQAWQGPVMAVPPLGDDTLMGRVLPTNCQPAADGCSAHVQGGRKRARGEMVCERESTRM